MANVTLFYGQSRLQECRNMLHTAQECCGTQDHTCVVVYAIKKDEWQFNHQTTSYICVSCSKNNRRQVALGENCPITSHNIDDLMSIASRLRLTSD